MYIKKIKDIREKGSDCLPKVTSIPKFTPAIALALVTTDDDDVLIKHPRLPYGYAVWLRNKDASLFP